MRWLWPIVVVTAVLLPNAAAMILPFEAWPYTNAPMFAADLARIRLYRLHMTLERPGQPDRELEGWKHERIPDWHLRRLFLISAYGSMDPDTAFGFVKDDSPDRLRARLQKFFHALVKGGRRGAFDGVTAVRVSFERTDDHETHVVGRYTVADDAFHLQADDEARP